MRQFVGSLVALSLLLLGCSVAPEKKLAPAPGEKRPALAPGVAPGEKAGSSEIWEETLGLNPQEQPYLCPPQASKCPKDRYFLIRPSEPVFPPELIVPGMYTVIVFSIRGCAPCADVRQKLISLVSLRDDIAIIDLDVTQVHGEKWSAGELAWSLMHTSLGSISTPAAFVFNPLGFYINPPHEEAFIPPPLLDLDVVDYVVAIKDQATIYYDAGMFDPRVQLKRLRGLHNRALHYSFRSQGGQPRSP